MLSHLRFHRRAPSNPSSPLPDQAPAFDASAQHEKPQSARDVSPRPDARAPFTLPPIARVSSTGSDHFFTSRGDGPPPPQDVRIPVEESKSGGFLGGVALQNYRRAVQGPQPPESSPAMSSQLPDSLLSRAKPAPPPINTGLAARPAIMVDKQARSSSFFAPTDLQQGSVASSGKRPSKKKLATEPAPATSSGPAPEPQKGRKGLPFLKNPMSSLLMRRKTGHTVPEPPPPAPSYDPRIRGTRVHDFSAPRPKKTVSLTDSIATQTPEATPKPGVSTGDGEPPAPPLPAEPAIVASQETTDNRPNGDTGLETQEARAFSGNAVPEQTQPPVPPKDEPAISLHSSSSAASKETQLPPLPRTTAASVRTIASRLSVTGPSRRDSVASAIPKHMKSTSSRFSFDMAGAAKQERLLEERHRQREQEKKTTDEPNYGQSRFDDYDDDFDYDAMMDDDGLEERIPGVNADYEDEEDPEALDPDNDQENFAGFTFQRSNPVSSLPSPAVQTTPRDANGTVIGFAMTKDTTPETSTSASPMVPAALTVPKVHDMSGLGIQGEEASMEPISGPNHSATTGSFQPRAPPHSDDIYFDDGLADELDFEPDGFVFDESIFDNNDTDQYGRPIPGAFAQAQDAMRAAQQNSKRDSDMTSDLSGQSGVTQSTGHTSLSAVAQPLPAPVPEKERTPSPKQSSREESQVMDINNQDLAYQAALAAAAQNAAASGRFGRDSPDPASGAPATPPTDSAELDDYSQPNPLDDYENDEYGNDLDNYEDDDYANNFDDFDFDDEAIIAEANASALANDADGFYGQEFGFYSAPIPQPPHVHHQTPSSTNNVLTSENLYQYAAGGYFGPAGASSLNRSTSGRVVCREPNLTPITERSEYSNRNSVMSFTLPPAIGNNEGGAGAGGGGRNSASLTGPPPMGLALAQLALLEDEGDVMDSTMSLEALMRLRTRAWGGSQASSREGSPRSERAGGFGHARVNSGLSLWSNSDAGGGVGGAGSGAASPILGNSGGGGGGGGGVGGGFPTPLSAPPLMGPGSLPPRPGSAGAVGSSNGFGVGVVSPLPQRPQSLFLPPISTPVPAPSPGQLQLGGGSACSPVLEGEEVDDGAGLSPGLAPALPLHTKSSAPVVDGAGCGHQFVGELVSRVAQQTQSGVEHKGPLDGVGKDAESGEGK